MCFFHLEGKVLSLPMRRVEVTSDAVADEESVVFINASYVHSHQTNGDFGGSQPVALLSKQM